MKKLEEHHYFKYIAWATIILFAVFTYNLTMQLASTSSDLDERTNTLNSTLQNS